MYIYIYILHTVQAQLDIIHGMQMLYLHTFYGEPRWLSTSMAVSPLWTHNRWLRLVAFTIQFKAILTLAIPSLCEQRNCISKYHELQNLSKSPLTDPSYWLFRSESIPEKKMTPVIGEMSRKNQPMVVNWDSKSICRELRYPLVNVHKKTMENHHAIHGKIHYFYGHVPCRYLCMFTRPG